MGKKAKKQNPLLDQFEAMLNAKYKQKLEINSEFDYIAFMKTVHEELGVGPGRAGRVFNAFLANKIELAEDINEDYGPDKENGDKQILYTKKKYAYILRGIFSKEDWMKHRVMFPLLREYWDD